ncbi:MFS transporter [Lysinibacter cavernae]|uniref:MFS family permease n=1 Tax=Lysinibacter cavernae TaxID=1640652 RepID=A0A7X5TTE3_9MICO|nr:MFS transporter [Lysinibacter cavernae]NIH54100.1 MFS family permease [Lysinibacter cavernae]
MNSPDTASIPLPASTDSVPARPLGDTSAEDPSAQPPQIGLALSAVLLMYTGQMILNPIIAPLSREVGLAEWQVGVMVSVAALSIVLSSQFWGRKSQSWGRKPVLVGVLSLGAAAMAGFAALSWLGIEGILTGTPLWILFVLVRGLVFGVAIAAVAPTVQAYIADVTTSEQSRIRGMAGVGAAQGIAMVGGATLGGILASVSLLLPIVIIPVVLGGAAILLAVRLRPEAKRELIEHPVRVSPFDPRVWPFLIAGFGMYTSLGFIQIITGFIIQDRNHLDGQATALFTGISLLTAGIGMVLAQSLIVPRVSWHPSRLLRVGAVVALLGFALLTMNAGLAILIAAIFLVGLGLGIAMPGYTAGPSLLMDRDEQGGLAGILGANTALTFVVAPTAATALYGVWPLLPILVSVAVMIGLSIFLALHPRFRR